MPTPRKILLVDDSRDLLDVYLALLQASTPHNVRTASSGRAALEIVRIWRPDLVITDIMMPDMSGLELISHLRSELPPPLPIIAAWSGFPDFESEARQRGARVFQPKPIDPEDLVVLVESLLAERELPHHLRAGAAARRLAASDLAQARVSATLARRPVFQEVAGLNARLIARYFDGAEVAVLLMREGRMHVFAASDPRWLRAGRADSILGYAGNVLESGSTLIVPDLSVMPAAPRAQLSDVRQLVAVPLRFEGVAIGALALADSRALPFDVDDLAIFEHLGAAYGDVFAGRDAARPPREPAVLSDESWRFALRHELEHLRPEQSLVVALASVAPRRHPRIPVSSPAEMEEVVRVLERLIARIPPRVALGRLEPTTLAAYGLVADGAEGERDLCALLASLADEPARLSRAVLTVTALQPPDGGAALVDIARGLLASAIARGPGTTLGGRLGMEVIAPRGTAA